MDDKEFGAIKRLLAEEFGITGISDPVEASRALETRMAGMNRMDLMATDVKLGQLLREEHQGGAPPARYVILGYLVFTAAAWFLWRPLGIVIPMFGVATAFRSFSIRNSMFWARKAVVLFGATYGILQALLARLGVWVSHATGLGIVAFALFGLVAVAYSGHGPGDFGSVLDDGRRSDAAAFAVVAYLLCAVVFVVARFI